MYIVHTGFDILHIFALGPPSSAQVPHPPPNSQGYYCITYEQLFSY